MILALALLAYASAVGFLMPSVMRAMPILGRHPRLGIATWQGAQVGFVLSLVLAAAALVLPALSFGEGTAHLKQMFGLVITHLGRDPQRHPEQVVGLVAAAALTAFLISAWGRSIRQAGHTRQEHRCILGMVSTRHPETGALVVESEIAAAYCLAGKQGTIVVTSAALHSLTDLELAAVLAHERAHLRGRHHWIKQSADGFARAFGRLPLSRVARVELARLIEMAADDAAVRASSATRLVSALLIMGSASLPPAGLAANEGVTTQRIRRLAARPDAAPRWAKACIVGFAILTATGPGLIAASPGMLASGQHCTL